MSSDVLVEFDVPQGDPAVRRMYLPVLPRRYDYVSLGDGISYYVRSVVHLCGGYEFDGDVWTRPGSGENLLTSPSPEPVARIELARGRPPQ